MDKILQVVIEFILGFLMLTCGSPPEDSPRISELVGAGSSAGGARFACIIQVNQETWLTAGKIFKVDDTDQLPDFN